MDSNSIFLKILVYLALMVKFMILLQDSACIAHQINILTQIQNLANSVLEELAFLSNKNNVFQHQLVLDLMEQIVVIQNAHKESSMMSYWGIALITIILEYVPMRSLITMLRLIDVWNVQLAQGLTM